MSKDIYPKPASRTPAPDPAQDWPAWILRHALPLTLERLDKDINDIFVRLVYTDAGGRTVKTSVLSGGATPAYAVRTVTYFNPDGTIAGIYTLDLDYDLAGDLVEEVLR
jgi:hypothetical protein